jgi:hypothetical protein
VFCLVSQNICAPGLVGHGMIFDYLGDSNNETLVIMSDTDKSLN